MENVKSFFDSFKEFIWDIIGYLLPGSYLLILLSSIVKEEFYYSSSLILMDKGIFVGIFIVLSYIIGYVVYSVGLLKEIWRGNNSYAKKIETEVSKRENFKIAKEFLVKALQEKGSDNDLQNASVRDIRNIAMGFAPEADQKIYTFMFRSEFANHIANVSFVVGIIGILCSFIHLIPWNSIQTAIIFKVGGKFALLYGLLFTSYFVLRAARDRFYSIAIGLPFSILVSKNLNSHNAT